MPSCNGVRKFPGEPWIGLEVVVSTIVANVAFGSIGKLCDPAPAVQFLAPTFLVDQLTSNPFWLWKAIVPHKIGELRKANRVIGTQAWAGQFGLAA